MNFNMGPGIAVNDEELEQRGTKLRGGFFDGQFAVRPNAKMRSTRHAQGFRLPDEKQHWKPGDDLKNARVTFALYLWCCSDQRYYCVEEEFDVPADPCAGPEYLAKALETIAE